MTDLTLTSPTSIGAGHAVHSDAVWDYARRDYLDGDSASVVCARYGIARSTFWDRASAQGWRRRDQPPAALPAISFDMSEKDIDFDDMFEITHLRLGEAVKKGRATEVSAWLRVLAQLDKPLTELMKFREQDRVYAAAREQRLSDSPDSSD